MELFFSNSKDNYRNFYHLYSSTLLAENYTWTIADLKFRVSGRSYVFERQQLMNTAEDVADLLRKELSQKELELQEKDLQLHSMRSEMSSKNNEEELSAAKQEIRELMKQLQVFVVTILS